MECAYCADAHAPIHRNAAGCSMRDARTDSSCNDRDSQRVDSPEGIDQDTLPIDCVLPSVECYLDVIHAIKPAI